MGVFIQSNSDMEENITHAGLKSSPLLFFNQKTLYSVYLALTDLRDLFKGAERKGGRSTSEPRSIKQSIRLNKVCSILMTEQRVSNRELKKRRYVRREARGDHGTPAL